ncbi:MAG: DMT family transporter [Verrucomicrobiota bacterium]|nr:DMT family transporter [Verrucomicrobiota bacterium]
MIWAFSTTILFAISAVSAGKTTRVLGGIEANFWRILIATLFLGGYATTLGQSFAGNGLPLFFVSGVLGFGFGDIALYLAFPLLGSRLSILLVHCLAVPFATLVEWLWLGTQLTLPQVASSALILVGVGIALAPSEHLHLTRAGLTRGIIYGVLAAFGQGLGAVFSRKAYFISSIGGEHIDGITAAYQRIWGGVFVALLSIFILKRMNLIIWNQEQVDARHAEWRRLWPWLLLNALAGPGLGVAFYQWALATTPTGIVLPIVALTPLVIIPIARIINNERASQRSIMGGIIAVLGVIGLTLSK